MSSSNVRRALVTGATSGIGESIARRLAAAGHNVVVVGRDAARGAGVINAIRDAGGKADFAAADLTRPGAVDALVDEVHARFGNVDILVDNAGIFSFGPTIEATVSAFDAMYATNVKAPFFLTARLAPQMVTHGRGRIVDITTMVAHFGMAGAAVYGSSKAALQLLNKAWAAEFSGASLAVDGGRTAV